MEDNDVSVALAKHYASIETRLRSGSKLHGIGQLIRTPLLSKLRISSYHKRLNASRK